MHALLMLSKFSSNLGSMWASTATNYSFIEPHRRVRCPHRTLKITNLRNSSLIYLFFIPSVVKDDSVSLRFGHATALTVHRTVIHYRVAALLP